MLDPDTASIAYNVVDGAYYSMTEGDFGDPPVIATFDPETGDVAEVITIARVADNHTFNGAVELMFGADGVAYVNLSWLIPDCDEFSSSLYTLEIKSGIVDKIETVSYSHPDAGSTSVQAVTPRSDVGFWGSYFYAGEHGNVVIPFGSFQPEEFSLFDADTFDSLEIKGVEDNVREIALVPADSCAVDVNADGALDILDFVAFQILFVNQDPKADCDANGAFSILDFVCFQQLFQAGCP
jgi:hypothetical protein